MQIGKALARCGDERAWIVDVESDLRDLSLAFCERDRDRPAQPDGDVRRLSTAMCAMAAPVPCSTCKALFVETLPRLLSTLRIADHGMRRSTVVPRRIRSPVPSSRCRKTLMLARNPTIQPRPQTLMPSRMNRRLSHGNSRWTTGASTADTKMNAPSTGLTWFA